MAKPVEDVIELRLADALQGQSVMSVQSPSQIDRLELTPTPDLGDQVNHSIAQSEIEGGVHLDELPKGVKGGLRADHSDGGKLDHSLRGRKLCARGGAGWSEALRRPLGRRAEGVVEAGAKGGRGRIEITLWACVGQSS